MKNLKEKLVERIDQLLQKADKVKATHKPNPPGFVGFPTLDDDIFLEWKSSAEHIIIIVGGENSVYHKNFVKKVKEAHIGHVDSGIGILRALKEDLGLGYMVTVKDLILAEVFADFLDIAKHLLENNYKDPAASLTGAVLENSLRKIARKSSIPVKNGDDIGSLNMKIADKGVYNRLMQKQVQVWKSIRDSADHGKFNDYDSDDVESMIKGVEKFLGEKLD